MSVRLIGDGGHAKNIRDILCLRKIKVSPTGKYVAIAFGGVDCEALEKRYKEAKKHTCFTCIHPTAIWSAFIELERGVQLMAGCIVQANAWLSEHCIINTGAIIEHDAVIGKGCHIAPGAVVLGGAKIGDFSFVGANAVVVQGVEVPPRTFIKAGSVWTGK